MIFITRTTQHVTFLAILIFSLMACTKGPKSADAIASISADQQLEELVESQWQRSLKETPDMASFLGDKRYNDKWQDLSIDAITDRNKKNQLVLANLANIDYQSLSKANKVNYELFKWQIQTKVDAFAFSPYVMPMDQLEGIQFIDQQADYFPLDTFDDYQDWLTRMQALPALISQTITLMETGIEQGIVSPKAMMSRIPEQVKVHLVDDPQSSLFFAKFTTFPKTISPEQQRALTAQAKVIIENDITPAYQKLYDYLINEYLPQSRETVGIWDIPNGKAYYQYLISHYTTTNLTFDEIHQLGLKEVARNRAAMDEVIKEVNFKGSFNEFLTFLRTDPQFYYKTSEELLEGYQAISKRLDPQLTKLFGKLPRSPYGVFPISAAMAPDSTTAYYMSPSADGKRPGHYYVNLYQPETRPKYEMEVLSVHEAVPGHHLQIALQMEQENLPEFRRYLDFVVFSEGWGLYSERLGYDMGLYKDPYSRFGQLTYDMWRAVRLVVDTGIHAKGWTRQQAIDYFMKNAAKTEQDITNEIDRYIAWPGQALAYKIGQLKIIALREQAEQALGDKFDIRAFHDTVLENGAIPLNVLEDKVTEWISASK